MMDNIKVNKHLIHKDSDEDVLIVNSRGQIPAYFKFDQTLKNEITEDDFLFLKKYYLACNILQASLSSEYIVFRLRSILPTIEQLPGAEEEPGANVIKETLHLYYQKNQNLYSLTSQFLNEIHELQLLTEFGSKELQIPIDDRAKISSILERTSSIRIPKIQYTTMFNDANNYYFYRKHHEHVPGVMFIEVARQAMYEHFYKYSSYLKGQVSLSIQTLTTDFKNYANTNYPIHLMVEDIVGPSADEQSKSIQALEKKVIFYQYNLAIVEIKLKYLCIKIDLFKKIREVNPEPSHRFIPIKNFTKNIFISTADDKSYECKLNSLSVKGLNVTLPLDAHLEVGSIINYVFSIDTLGFIHGKAQLRWVQHHQDGINAGLMICEMEEKIESLLKDAIKNFTHVNTQREIA